VDLLVFLLVSFAEFIFKYLLFSSVERDNGLLPSLRHEPQRKADKVRGSNKYFFQILFSSWPGGPEDLITKLNRARGRIRMFDTSEPISCVQRTDLQRLVVWIRQ
jgi:hypothetical protein